MPVNSACNTIVREYSWQQADQLGRNDIRQAIINAEKILFDNLSYWPAPVYSSTVLPWPRYINVRLQRMGRMDARGGWIPVILPESQIQNIGIKAYTELDDAAALTYTDQDGDGLLDTFTCSAPTTVTDPDEIAIYFQTADRLVEDNWLSDRWRIEPVNVSFLMGTVTITGKRWLCVKPVLYEDKDHYPIDPTVNANFITHVMIYRRYTNQNGLVSTTDSQAALIWETKPCWWGCSSTSIPSGSDPASEGWVTARAGIRSKEDGIVIPAEAVYDASTGLWSHPSTCFNSCSEPDRVLIRYLAGVDLDSKGWMQKFMRTLVSRLSALR